MCARVRRVRGWQDWVGVYALNVVPETAIRFARFVTTLCYIMISGRESPIRRF